MSAAKPARIFLFTALLINGQLCVAADEPVGSQSAEYSALQTSILQQQKIADYRNRLAELETEFGVYDYRLLETLQGLTEALIEARDVDGAGSILTRRLQLLRTINGPENLDQLPIISEQIINDIRQQDWESVADRFEYIAWLHAQDENTDTATLLKIRSNVVDWLLASIYFENPGFRIRRFLDARQLQKENLSLAEDSYEENSPKLIPWLYRHAILQVQVFAFVKSLDELGASARYEISSVEGRSAASYLREGLGTVKRIRKILESQGEPEAEAMAMIAVADFQMLLGLGTAARLYRSAIEKLKEAGLPEEQVESFFLRPIVLPVYQFHFSLQAALDDQVSYGYKVQTEKEQEQEGEVDLEDKSFHLGDFIAWNKSLPFIQRPPIPQLASSVTIEFNEIDLIFSINSRGKSTNPKVVQAEPDTARFKRDARDAIKDMQFRPRFVNGRWRRAEYVTMRYLFLPR